MDLTILSHKVDTIHYGTRHGTPHTQNRKKSATKKRNTKKCRVMLDEDLARFPKLIFKIKNVYNSGEKLSNLLIRLVEEY